MKAAKQSESTVDLEENWAEKNSAAAISRVRVLVSDLWNEVESLALFSLPGPERSSADNSDSVDFYEAVSRFEIALIKNALRCTNWNQVQAARLLNLSATTLNTKIKQYQIGTRFVPVPGLTDTTPAFCSKERARAAGTPTKQKPRLLGGKK